MESIKCCVSIRKSSCSIPNEFFEDLGKIVEAGTAVVHDEGQAKLLFSSHANVGLFVKSLHGNYIGDTVLDATFSCKEFHTHSENDVNKLKMKLQSVISDWEPKIMENVRKNLLQGLNYTCYKTVKCEKEKCDILNCIFYHSDLDKRRNPLNIPYLKKSCYQKSCIRGVKCRFSHNMFEGMFHPTNMYKNPCSRSREKCFRTNPLCLGAHKDSPELFFSSHWKDMLVTGTTYAFQYLAGAIRRFTLADPIFKNCRIFFMGYTEEFLKSVQNSVAQICHMHCLPYSSVGEEELEPVVFGTPVAFNTADKHIQLLSFNVVIVSQLNQIMANEEAKTAMVQFFKRCNYRTEPPYIQKLFVADTCDGDFKPELEQLLGENIHMPSGNPESIIVFKFDVPHNPMKGHPFWLPAKNNPDVKFKVPLTDDEMFEMEKANKLPPERNNSPSNSLSKTEERLKGDGQIDLQNILKRNRLPDSVSSKASTISATNDDMSASLKRNCLSDSGSSKRSRTANVLNNDIGSYLGEKNLEINRITGDAKRQHQSNWDSSGISWRKRRRSSGSDNRCLSPRPVQSTESSRSKQNPSPRTKPLRSRRPRRNRRRLRFPKSREGRSKSPRSKNSRSISSRSLKYLRINSRSLSFRRNREKSSSPSLLSVNRSNSSSCEVSLTGTEKPLEIHANEMETDEMNKEVENRISHLLEISSACYSKDSLLKQLGKDLFKEFVSQERKICMKLDEEFEVYRTMPDMYDNFEECYGNFMEKYILKFPNEDEEHKDLLWTVFWQSRFKYVKKSELEQRISMLLKEYVTKSSRGQASISWPFSIAPSTSNSAEIQHISVSSTYASNPATIPIVSSPTNSSSLSLAIHTPFPPPAPNRGSSPSSPTSCSSFSLPTTRFSNDSSLVSSICALVSSVKCKSFPSVPVSIPKPFSPRAPSSEHASVPVSSITNAIPASGPIPFPPPTITHFSVPAPFPPPAPSISPSATTTYLPFPPPPPLSSSSLIPSLGDNLPCISAPLSTFNSLTNVYSQHISPIPFPSTSLKSTVCEKTEKHLLDNRMENILSEGDKSSFNINSRTPLSIADDGTKNVDNTQHSSISNIIHDFLKQCRNNAKDSSNVPMKDPDLQANVQRMLISHAATAQDSVAIKSSHNDSEKVARGSSNPSHVFSSDDTLSSSSASLSTFNSSTNIYSQSTSMLFPSAFSKATVCENTEKPVPEYRKGSILSECGKSSFGISSPTPSILNAVDATKNVNNAQSPNFTNIISDIFKHCRSKEQIAKDSTNVAVKDADLQSNLLRILTSHAETAQDSAVIKSNLNEPEKFARSAYEEILISENKSTLESLNVTKSKSLSQNLKNQESKRKIQDSEISEYDVQKTLAFLKISVPDMGIVGHGIASLLEKVKDLGNTTKEALKMFTDPENIFLLEMGLKKFKSTCTSEEKMTFSDNLEQSVRNLLIYAQKVRKAETRLNVEAIAKATINRDTAGIIDMIRNVALYQGLELDNKEINEIFLQICSIHLEKSINKIF